MSTFELSPAVHRSPAAAARRLGSSLRTPGAVGWLAIGLLLLLLYAAFAQGAVRAPAEPRLQVATAAIAVLAAAAGIWSGTLRLRASPATWAGVALLAGLAVWNAMTLLWSVSADATWVEVNRYLEYALVLCLGIAVGASSARSLEMVAGGMLTAIAVVALYALGQKVVPGLHLAGLHLNQNGGFSRLQEPFGYWNALALFMVIGGPLALALAAEHARPVPLRLAAAGVLELLLLVAFFTYSRGGLVALAVALVVLLTLGGQPLRALLWLALVGLSALPPLLYGLLDHALSASGVPLGAREGAGWVLGALVVLTLAALLAGALRVIALERRVVITPARRRGIARALCLLGAALLLALALALVLSNRGFIGTFTHAWRSFTSPQAVSQSSPDRLLSTDSEYRWGWWREAADAFSARPLGGWGAGSFPVIHLLYRSNGLTVMQPHSVPLQWLAETGIVGALLGIGSFICLLGAGLGAVRGRLPAGRRLLGAAFLAAGFAYAVHSCYDWDSDIPGVTLPALLLLGVLGGAGGSGVGSRRARSVVGGVGVGISGRRPGEALARSLPAGGWRTLALVLIVAAMCSFGLSASLPSLAQTDSNSALAAAVGARGGGLVHARALAVLASRLDPLSDSGPRAETTLAMRDGQYLTARDDLLVAVRRDPSDRNAWDALAGVDLDLRDPAAAEFAARRAVALDPAGWLDDRDFAYAEAVYEYDAALLLQAPPAASATRLATPGYADGSPPG